MSDVTKVLIAQVNMVCINNDIDTFDHGQVCKSCGQDTELRDCIHARWQTWKEIVIMALMV